MTRPRSSLISLAETPWYHVVNRCVRRAFLCSQDARLRRDNVLAMRWEWFDAARGTLTIPAEKDKAKKGFVLHLSSDVSQLLRDRQDDANSEWVFPNPKTGRPYHSCRNAWVSACEKAGLPGLRMHDLRHTFVPLPGRGKRGGARVIYYHWVSKEQCYLLYAYAKNVSANLTSQQLQRLAEVMQAEIRDE